MKSSDPSNETILLQTEAVKQKVNEAMIAESKRRRYLIDSRNNISEERKKQLVKRYEEDRNRDQESIKNLVSDLESLKMNVTKGQVDFTTRQHKKMARSIQTMHTNRFHRQVLYLDYNGNRQLIEKIDGIDEKARRRRAAGIYNEYDERKKLSLLINKRDILTRLSAMQHSEIGLVKEAGGSSSSSCLGSGRPRAHSAAGSLYSARTDESWATFASSNPPSSRSNFNRSFNNNNINNNNNRKIQSGQSCRPHHVPALKL
mmetsp:Transcript_8331/g.8495  ORF Transcript_8331/g.8495 Transcript_8331/m.8495 type:complete len:259 (+) Transcript_8331:211-987(+)